MAVVQESGGQGAARGGAPRLLLPQASGGGGEAAWRERGGAAGAALGQPALEGLRQGPRREQCGPRRRARSAAGCYPPSLPAGCCRLATLCRLRLVTVPTAAALYLRRRLHELRLHPDGFADYLCSQLGFRLLKQFGVEGPASAGFDRPMLLLRKPRPRPAAPSGQQEWREAEQAAEQRWRQEEGQAAAADAEQEEDAWLEGEGEDGEEPWEQTTAEEAQ